MGRGKHACVDLTGVSPLVWLKDKGFVVGQSVLKAEASKVAKHEKVCLENQHVFVPFAFDTFGGLVPDAVRLLNRVQKVVNSNSSSLKVSNFVFSRIGFSIQREWRRNLLLDYLPSLCNCLFSCGMILTLK
ncbi:putative exostosin [Helianthus annuus]|nr:putative exostosin [Helianthus annuus]KAJ0471639.1 putative exostosin [Helianthus annuus]KAJ0647279.1 putative exostosin [Helianthus annuus]KAJ0651165.1 putative exostosin [Helianthus annuus]KAJ0843029.1 putative exostosin [Helianthus annuus]